ncbi:hypothetical protein M9Y10_021207 [Tritrichomonas musculus]|uniref:DUF3447 domain-containing protein n=1 Tax=Tritrichomonas musculus TaxID=1915356 RepID=A0ABR2HE82_9EUKA
MDSFQLKEIQNYINEFNELYNTLLTFLEDSEYNDDNFNNLNEIIKLQEFDINKDKFLQFLQILISISNNHHRGHTFFSKIKQIILNYQEQIKQFFSNIEIFRLFQTNFLIMHHLIKNKILTIDEEIIFQLFQSKNSMNIHLCNFFYPQLKKYIEENGLLLSDELEELEASFLIENSNMSDEEFEEKQEKGENDSYICSLIRDDLVKDFIVYINQTNYALDSYIKPSIFETNQFLIDKQTSLIEYCAFFGSIQIIQHLLLSKIKMNSSIWLYGIHSNEPELIHLFEEYKILPIDSTYDECLKESIKCHHNEIASYLNEFFYVYLNVNPKFNPNKNKEDNEPILNEKYYLKDVFTYAFQFYNYVFMPQSYEDKFLLFAMCQFNYIYLVKILAENNRLDINIKMILKKHCFLFNKISNHSF